MGWPVASLCQIAAVSARMRCMTRAMTPPGVRLSQRLEQGCARPLLFTFAGRAQQLDSTLGRLALETTAEVVLVADESLSGRSRGSSHSAARRSRRVSRSSALAPGSGRRRWAGAEGCRPGAGAGPGRSGCGRRSSRFGPTCRVGAFDGLAGAAAFHRGTVHDPYVVAPRRGGGGRDPVDASHRTGGLAQPLVVAGLLGQA